MKYKLTLKTLSLLVLVVSNVIAAESSNLVVETDANTNSILKPTASSVKAKPSVKRKIIRHQQIKSKNYQNISSINFDFTYNGDLPGALKQLKEYDYTLNVLNPLGKRQDTTVSIDLQNTNIDTVISTINAQIDGYGTVRYNPNDNSIRILYASKIRDIGYDAMMESKKWREGHKPKPIISPDGVLLYPFGFYQPVIPCKIGMVCDIRLGAGEILMDWAISDIGNWQMYSKSNGRDSGGSEPSLAFSGAGNDLTPHILIKPTAAATTTNLVVLTNKRTYNILLQATNNDYVLSAGFYFPNALIQGVEDEKQKLRAQAESSGQSSDSDTPDAYGIDMSKLNYNDYEISGDNVSWKPTSVIDDGEKVWIKFADNNQISPILVELNKDNPEQPYRLIRYFPQPGNMYLVNRMFDEAILVKGINDQAQTVHIKRKKADQSIWHKIFG